MFCNMNGLIVSLILKGKFDYYPFACPRFTEVARVLAVSSKECDIINVMEA